MGASRRSERDRCPRASWNVATRARVVMATGENAGRDFSKGDENAWALFALATSQGSAGTCPSTRNSPTPTPSMRLTPSFASSVARSGVFPESSPSITRRIRWSGHSPSRHVNTTSNVPNSCPRISPSNVSRRNLCVALAVCLDCLDSECTNAPDRVIQAWRTSG